MNRIIAIMVVCVLFFTCKKDADKEGDKETYSLQTTITPQAGGTVSITDAESNEVVENTSAIIEGTKVLIKALPSSGYKFARWEGDVNAPRDEALVTMNSDIRVTATFRADGGTPVQVYGELSVNKSNIVDRSGIPVQLRGMSLFWSQWMGQFWNKDVVNWLADDWEISIIRASMGVDDADGYIHKAAEKLKVETVVDEAINKGIYVIIDWHSHHAEDYLSEAVTFFKEMAEKYGSTPNVIYEIYNEPLNVSWNLVLKPYAEAVIKAIREVDPDNLIIVGTPNWSQNVDEVIGNELEGKNIAYAFHFYASESAHLGLMKKAEDAIAKGLPLVVTEWGVSEASGDGNFNLKWTQDWLALMDKHKLTWCNWSVADKNETSSALLPGANSKGGWEVSELSESGGYIRQECRKHKGYSNPN